MEYDQSNPNYKKPDYYSYNPQTANQPANFSGSGFELDPKFSTFNAIPPKGSGSFLASAVPALARKQL